MIQRRSQSLCAACVATLRLQLRWAKLSTETNLCPVLMISFQAEDVVNDSRCCTSCKQKCPEDHFWFGTYRSDMCKGCVERITADDGNKSCPVAVSLYHALYHPMSRSDTDIYAQSAFPRMLSDA